MLSGGEYHLWIKTLPDSKPANGGKVYITAYGDKGKSKDIEVSGGGSDNGPFAPGNTDEFEVELYIEAYTKSGGNNDYGKWPTVLPVANLYILPDMNMMIEMCFGVFGSKDGRVESYRKIVSFSKKSIFCDVYLPLELYFLGEISFGNG